MLIETEPKLGQYYVIPHSLCSNILCIRSTCVILWDEDVLSPEFLPKQKITEVNGKNNGLEIMLEDANRLMKFYLTKEKSVTEGKFLSFHLKTRVSH